MWSEACEMLARAERLHRQLFRPMGSIAQSPAWEPRSTFWRRTPKCWCSSHCLEWDTENVEAALDGAEYLLVAGTRTLPSELRTAIIHRLELPQGRFERRVRLPTGRYEAVRRSSCHGCLLITLQKAGTFRG
jgi:HSP20 family protein